MYRYLIAVVLIWLLLPVSAIADTAPGCLATEAPITWTLPRTPGTPNWTLSSTFLGVVSASSPMPTPVSFNATFWRRAECATQLLMTYSAQNQQGDGQVMFTVSQNGYNDFFGSLVVNDPTLLSGNNFNFDLTGPITGIIPISDYDIDLSKSITISYTPLIFSGATYTRGTPVILQIPAASSVSTPFAIGPGITGSWYNPNQSGHGFSIEVLPNNQLLAYWYVYAPPPQGGQAWIVASGTYNGNSASNLTAFWEVGSGGLFPPAFNPNALQEQRWGTISFTFSDCSHGTASWQPAIAGYSAGSMSISRLTMPAGLSCP